MKLKLFISIFMLLLFSLSVQAQTPNYLKKADNILHTTVFHNKDHQTLKFLVTFGIGYKDGNNCQVVKQRIFEAIHPDGYEAHNYGRYLAKEYGPELFTCVHENLHVLGSQFPDENITYTLTNNGEYYTSAIPSKNNVYPK